MNNAFYSNSIVNFLAQNEDEILGIITKNDMAIKLFKLRKEGIIENVVGTRGLYQLNSLSEKLAVRRNTESEILLPNLLGWK